MIDEPDDPSGGGETTEMPEATEASAEDTTADQTPETTDATEPDATDSPDAEMPSFEEMAATEMEAEGPVTDKNASDLEAVFDVPVRISVVLGRTKMPVASLLKMDVGTVVELDRQVGEAIDIYVNQRLVARGEIVLVEDRLGVTMTEIIKAAS